MSPSTKTVANGSTAQLTATTVPANKAVTWTSSDETKATVDANGLVTAKAASGSATITATAVINGQSYTDTCTITCS